MGEEIAPLAMRRAILVRTLSGDDGTFGSLRLDDGASYITGELPWRTNANDISCIPVGRYTCVWRLSHRRKRNIYHVERVPGRTAVQIHSGNYVGDTAKGKKADALGCIILGRELGKDAKTGQMMVLRSKDALSEFEAKMGGQTFLLEITEA